ncbi:uncharacterized protein BCR38DRAFT_331564 [Pseudomassariella vexata]|uniref:Uncharacterized protein n=1 Tax=Pseudomassariella vexata TaxID=1141098 RepID=A0A1Y2EHP3_9PEZI|nr:uncharacterized protein BCR38DRAFT_331564 [Pseudomassariella vexata]ORY71091.1 hypothetical protein BCR38DRAFT_331564 [Pseudomassariella vexata]
MEFFEDPRLRQRWNQISHTTEAVTENAAAGIWTFGHTYINPCLASLSSAVECCTAPCLGDREERARRARDRDRARGRAEYSFDFYDDWDDELAGDDPGGILGGWHNEDWDRLLAGRGRSKRGGAGEINEQPLGGRRGMNYGTSSVRRKSSIAEDPTIIPSTAPIGFLGRFPFKFGGTLRYKPSAANLQEHPGAPRHVRDGEHEPLLGTDSDDGYHPSDIPPQNRKRSGTSGSGDTSDSYRSRGDLFPSDGEGDFEEDAVALGDEFAFALSNVDDQSSSKTKSSKGKRIAERNMPRSCSRTTINSTQSKYSIRPGRSPGSTRQSNGVRSMTSLEDLQLEEDQIRQEEDEEVERKRQAAARLAVDRELRRDDIEVESVLETKAGMVEVGDVTATEPAELVSPTGEGHEVSKTATPEKSMAETWAAALDAPSGSDPPGFVPARLPYFR